MTSCGWSGGQSHPEAEALLIFRRSMEAANLPTFVNFRNAKKSNICVIVAKKSRVAMKLGGAKTKLGEGYLTNI